MVVNRFFEKWGGFPLPTLSPIGEGNTAGTPCTVVSVTSKRVDCMFCSVVVRWWIKRVDSFRNDYCVFLPVAFLVEGFYGCAWISMVIKSITNRKSPFCNFQFLTTFYVLCHNFLHPLYLWLQHNLKNTIFGYLRTNQKLLPKVQITYMPRLIFVMTTLVWIAFSEVPRQPETRVNTFGMQ